MRILFTIVNISNCGGTERVMLSIASELCKHGHEVHVLSHYGNGKAFFSYDGRIRIHSLLSSLEARIMSAHPKYLIWKSRLLIKCIRPEVVIDTDLLTPNLTIPALVGSSTMHVAWDNMSYEYFKKAPDERLSLDKMMSYGSHLVVLTKSDQENYSQKESFPIDRIHQIYNPITVETPSVRYIEKEKKVLSIGRFANEKGFDLLMKAWKIVEQSLDDWSLEIWGDTGFDTGNVHKTYDDLHLKRASLHGTTSDIAKKLQESSIYVLPSRYEPFGLVLLEASAYSLPLVAFDCPNGPREIIKDGYNGILVDPENVEALADAIIKLIKDKELREQMGRNAFEHSKEFATEKIIPQWESLLGTIL